MNGLPDFELVESDKSAVESVLVRGFMDKLSLTVKACQDKEAAVNNILADAYASVGFGPVMAVLKAYAGE